MKKFLSVLWTILEHLPWMWFILYYFAYNLIKTAPTPWHAECVWVAIFACLVLSADVRDYVRDGARKISDELERSLRKWK